MHGQRGDGEGRVERAEAVNVVDHAEQDGRGERRVRGQALQVVGHADPRWGAGVEARETSVAEGDLVIEADQFHEHVGDQGDEIGCVAGGVVGGHQFDCGFAGGARTFRGGSGGGGGGRGGGFVAVAAARGRGCG